MATVVLAKQLQMTGFSTTRNKKKSDTLRNFGVNHVLIDNGNFSAQVRAIAPEGVDCAIELFGTDALPNTLKACKVKGVTCFVGMLSNQWTVKELYPIDYLPHGVKLFGYASGVEKLPEHVLRNFLDAVETGNAFMPIDKVFQFEQLREAHERTNAGLAVGKMVVLTGT
ncbi:zinc-binding alcohol dehydrogenase domain-containing protein 2 [Paraphaeosphaeria sporulosa]